MERVEMFGKFYKYAEDTKFKCEKCGRFFESPKEVKESRGEFWGEPAFKRWYYSPCCEYEYCKVYQCKICGEWYGDEETHGGVCDNCINKCRKDFNEVYYATLGEKQSVDINPLIACVLDESDINAILLDYIRSNLKDVDCSEFIDADISYFGELLAKRKGGET